MVDLGGKIKRLRKEYGYTQKQLSNLTGVAVSAISSYESGSRSPSYDVLITLSRIFHVSTDYLLGLDKSETIDVSGLSNHEIEVIRQMIDLLRKHK